MLCHPCSSLWLLIISFHSFDLCLSYPNFPYTWIETLLMSTAWLAHARKPYSTLCYSSQSQCGGPHTDSPASFCRSLICIGKQILRRFIFFHNWWYFWRYENVKETFLSTRAVISFKRRWSVSLGHIRMLDNIIFCQVHALSLFMNTGSGLLLLYNGTHDEP